MEHLDKKYRYNDLTPEELIKLKEIVNSSTDEQISSLIQKSWLNDDIDTSNVKEENINKIKTRIKSEIFKTRTFHFSYTSFSKIAATILLPLFILSTLFLYKENKKQESENMVVSTSEGERANITLPDGSIISLNEKSKLTYTPKTFSKKERNIQFDGEGYFNVSKDKEHPFLINAHGLQIKVLGTKFNLHARKAESSAELILEEGYVSFTSLKTSDCVSIKPNQKAILDKVTGIIKIINNADIQKATAWKRKEMIFRNNSLAFVLQSIEKNYEINIKTTYKDSISDPFTGTIPSSNLNEALEVIEKSYHLKSTIIGKSIILTDQK